MRTPSLLISLGVAALLAACQTPARNGSINELPQSNPTATSTGLADKLLSRVRSRQATGAS